MTSRMTVGLFVLAIGASLGPGLSAQVPTEVPPPVPGAKPVAVERIKVFGSIFTKYINIVTNNSIG